MTKMRTALWAVSALSAALTIAGCGSNSGGGSTPAASSNVKISGVVSVSGSGTTGSKARYKSVLPPSSDPTQAGQKGSWADQPNVDSDAYILLQAASSSTTSAVPLADATVDIFDVNHPEWVFPIARTTSDSTGAFTLSTLRFAAQNGDSYVDGEPIPPGQYTIVATGISPVTGKKTVAMQNVAQDFSGTTSGTALVTQSSTVKPTVISMFGLEKNTDGTQTWGSTAKQLPANAGIPITFSVAMRPAAFFGADLSTATDDGVVIKTGATQVEGTWSFSPDWMTAIFTPTAALTPTSVYTVTVTGADTTTAIDPVYNVYDKELALTAVGTFTAIAVDTTAPQVTYTPTAAATGVTVDTPIRVYSNEPLNPLKLKLSATPTVGAHPGVTYIGETTKVTGKPYTYEFVLGTPLAVNSSYTATISGISDGAGNVANSETFTFSTETTSAGVSGTASADTAAIQLAVKTVFGKWVTALNDHNISTLTGLMSGEFVMEYDMASKGNGGSGFNEDDLNRDGVYDLDEFTTMLSKAFGYWEFCGTVMSGAIQPEAAPVINVNGGTADFEFKLYATTSVVNQQCGQMAPKESLYLTLENVNGKWMITRASEGVDTRGQTVHQADYLKLNLPVTGTALTQTAGNINNQLFSYETLSSSTGGTKSASAYVVMFYDVREPQVGMAVAIPPNENEYAGTCVENTTTTAIECPTDISGHTYGGLMIPPDNNKFQNVYANVSKEFGFWSDKFEPREGSTLGWQVFALGTSTVGDLRSKLCQGSANNNCTKQNLSLVSDIVGVSEQRTFKLPGIYKEMKVTVSASGQSLTYDEYLHGFDAGTAGTVDIKVDTQINHGSMLAGGFMGIRGSYDQYFPLPFVCTQNGTQPLIDDCTFTQTGVQLSMGMNDVDISDGSGFVTGNQNCQTGNTSNECDHSLKMHLRVRTMGGTPPAITLTSVVDDLSNNLTTAVNTNGYVETTGAKTINIAGHVDTGATGPVSTVNLWAWSDTYQANTQTTANVDGSGNFSINGLKIYKGFNWSDINVNGMYHARFGINEMTTGSVYVPPIDITVTAMDNETVLVDKKGQFMNVNVTEPDYTGITSADTAGVVISGKMLFTTDTNNPYMKPQYNIGSEGGWQGGELTVAADGSFTLNVPLYNGGTNVWFNDAKSNWFGMNIYTESGKYVSKPLITDIDGTAYNTTSLNKIQPGQRIPVASSGAACSATLSGEADVGSLNVYWNGSDGNNYFWDQQSLVVVDNGASTTDGRGTFTVTVPLVSTAGGASWSGFNGVDISDANWRWTHVEFDMSTGSCTYVAPSFTTQGDGSIAVVTPVNNGTPGTPLIAAGGANTNNANYSVDGLGQAMTDTVMRISGSYSRVGASIGVDMWACGGNLQYAAIVDGSGNWSIDLPAFNGYTNFNIHAGSTWFNGSVPVTNTNYPTPVMNITAAGVTAKDSGNNAVTVTNNSMPDACGDMQLDVGAGVSLTITGQTKGTGSAEKGSYYFEGTGGNFDIDATGNFTLTISGLYNGWNNIDLNDSKWNHFHFGVTTSNGNAKPQYIVVTSPAQSSNQGAGTVTVTGTVYLTPTGTTGTFTPNHVSSWVSACDMSNNCTYTSYSSDPLSGLPAITLGTDGSGNTTFTFDITSTGGNINLDVNSDGVKQDGGWAYHGLHMSYNDGNCGAPCSWNWKPGTKKAESRNLLEGVIANRRADEAKHRPRVMH